MEVFFGFLVAAWLFSSPFLLYNVWKSKKDIISRKNNIELSLLKSEEIREKLETDIKNLNEDILEMEAQNEGQLEAVEKLSNQFVNDSLKFICSEINANNYETSVKKAEKVFGNFKKFSIEFPKDDEKQFFLKIKEVFEEEVKKDEARREQLLIKERIRDEQKAEKEREEEIRLLESQTESISAALDRARKMFKDEHAAEVEALKKQLLEAQEKAERAKSQAQLTKAGFVYVVSNIGSFGEQVFKVGMTRRLEPMDRVKELGDASVPFPFDVHMMISCDNAPELETNLHRELHKVRLNKVNMHKEFFRVDLDRIAQLVTKFHAKVEYRAKPEALEYNETLLVNKRGDLVEFDSSVETDEEPKAS